MSTIIKGGTVVTADGQFRADVLVSGETIAAVGPELEVPAGARVIDASGAYVMPGGIDPHTHMQLPFMGTVASENFYTGTSAAAAGGKENVRRSSSVRSDSSVRGARIFSSMESARAARACPESTSPMRVKSGVMGISSVAPVGLIAVIERSSARTHGAKP